MERKQELSEQDRPREPSPPNAAAPPMAAAVAAAAVSAPRYRAPDNPFECAGNTSTWLEQARHSVAAQVLTMRIAAEVDAESSGVDAAGVVARVFLHAIGFLGEFPQLAERTLDPSVSQIPTAQWTLDDEQIAEALHDCKVQEDEGASFDLLKRAIHTCGEYASTIAHMSSSAQRTMLKSHNTVMLQEILCISAGVLLMQAADQQKVGDGDENALETAASLIANNEACSPSSPTFSPLTPVPLTPEGEGDLWPDEVNHTESDTDGPASGDAATTPGEPAPLNAGPVSAPTSAASGSTDLAVEAEPSAHTEGAAAATVAATPVSDAASHADDIDE
jgi:hypothetical protein